MIGMIAAVCVNGVIGKDNELPFDYSEDMKHFRKTTANSIVIMGRKTFEGIGKPLPKRRNIIISRGMTKVEGIEIVASMKEAIDLCSGDERDIWLCGGAQVYQDGMEFADKILLTLTPDMELANNTIKFPWINPDKFDLQYIHPLSLENDSKLMLATYIKNNSSPRYRNFIKSVG